MTFKFYYEGQLLKECYQQISHGDTSDVKLHTKHSVC